MKIAKDLYVSYGLSVPGSPAIQEPHFHWTVLWNQMGGFRKKEVWKRTEDRNKSWNSAASRVVWDAIGKIHHEPEFHRHVDL